MTQPTDPRHIPVSAIVAFSHYRHISEALSKLSLFLATSKVHAWSVLWSSSGCQVRHQPTAFHWAFCFDGSLPLTPARIEADLSAWAAMRGRLLLEPLVQPADIPEVLE